MLVFTKQAKLAAKLSYTPLKYHSPLKDYFPDYHGDPADVDAATEYLVGRFTRLNKHENKKIRVVVMPDLPANEDWKNIEQCYSDALKARQP